MMGSITTLEVRIFLVRPTPGVTRGGRRTLPLQLAVSRRRTPAGARRGYATLRLTQYTNTCMMRRAGQEPLLDWVVSRGLESLSGTGPTGGRVSVASGSAGT